MKKTIAFALAILMAFSVAACGNGKTANGDPSTSPTSPSGVSNPSATGNNPSGIIDGTEDEGYYYVPSPRGDVLALKLEMNNLQPKTPGTVTIYTNQLASCDPAHSTLAEHGWCENVYESLFKRGNNGEMEPVLATEWWYDDDGNFHALLREGVKFHDGAGTVMTAEDVLYTIQRVIDSPSAKAHSAMQCVDMANSYAENDYHVVIAFNYPSGAFLNYMGSSYMGIVNKAFFEAAGPDYSFTEMSAGTGAYYLVETVTGVSQTFKRFDEYWGGKPEMDTIKIMYYSDFTAMGIDFENRDIDITFINPWDNISGVFDGTLTDAYYYNVTSSRGIVMYTATMGDVALSDERIREALYLAINKEELTIISYDDLAIAVPSAGKYMQGAGSDELKYDPDRARELMTEAGYGPDHHLNLKLFASQNQYLSRMAEALQMYLGEIWIDLDIETGATSYTNTVINSTDFPASVDLLITNYTIYPDYLNFLDGIDAYGKEIGTFGALKGIDDENIHVLMTELETTTGVDERLAVFEELESTMAENYYHIPILVTTSPTLVQGYLENVNFRDGYGVYWKDLTYADWVEWDG